MPNDVVLEFDDVAPIYRRLARHYVNSIPRSELIKIGKLRVGKELPVEPQELVPDRTLPPGSDVVRGATIKALQKLVAPSMLESNPIQPSGHNLPVWTGWRPKREVVISRDENIVMPQPEIGRKFETEIPSVEKIRADAFQMAVEPYPTVDYGNEFSDPETWKGYGMGNLGQASSTPPAQQPAQQQSPGVFAAISNLAQSIASTVQAKYQAKADKYAIKAGAATGIRYSGSVPITPEETKPSKVSFATIALIGGGILAALFILPNLGKKRR